MSNIQKYYLIDKLPDTTSVSGRLPPDIATEMEQYKREKKDYMFKPPAIRPHPLSKYDEGGGGGEKDGGELTQRERESRIISGVLDTEEDAEFMGEGVDAFEDEEEEILNRSLTEGGLNPEETAAILETLPKHSRTRAKKILPWLLQINLGGEALADVLYDLAVPRVKKIRTGNLAVLRAVYRQLDSNREMPTSLLQRKLANEREAGQRLRRYARASIYTRPGHQNYPREAAEPAAHIILGDRAKYRRHRVNAYPEEDIVPAAEVAPPPAAAAAGGIDVDWSQIEPTPPPHADRDFVGIGRGYNAAAASADATSTNHRPEPITSSTSRPAVGRGYSARRARRASTAFAVDTPRSLPGETRSDQMPPLPNRLFGTPKSSSTPLKSRVEVIDAINRRNNRTTTPSNNSKSLTWMST